MNLMEQLQVKQEAAINIKAKSFAKMIKDAIVERAEKGHSNCYFTIANDNEDKFILRSELFINKLKNLMDGVKVELKDVEVNHLLFKLWEKRIVFSWDAAGKDN